MKLYKNVFSFSTNPESEQEKLTTKNTKRHENFIYKFIESVLIRVNLCLSVVSNQESGGLTPNFSGLFG